MTEWEETVFREYLKTLIFCYSIHAPSTHQLNVMPINPLKSATMPLIGYDARLMNRGVFSC